MIINTQATNAKLLVRALQLNGSFSLLSGLALLAFSTQFSLWFGQIEPQYIAAIGGGLILFALRLFYLAGPGKLMALEAKLIIGSDIGWVLASMVLIPIFFAQISLTGSIIATAIGIAVALFALLQAKGLKHYRSLA
jgi:hypothetical protein